MNIASSSGSGTIWVVVADESAVTFYSRMSRRAPLLERATLHNQVAHQKTGDLISDRGGRSFDRHGQGRHTMAKEKHGPKRHAAELFAKNIAEHLNDAKRDGSCKEFTLIAAPRFLGVLRDALTTVGDLTPVLAIDKEMVGRDTVDIEKLLDSR